MDMGDDMRDHHFMGSRYKKPLLEKPPIYPVKKTLLHHPGEALYQKKQPLLGAPLDHHHLLKTPWPATKRPYDDPPAPIASSTYHSTPNKRQALLPTPGEWPSGPKKMESEPNPVVSGGLLPRPYRSAPKSGLLPPPSSSSPHSMYSPPTSPIPPSENGKQSLSQPPTISSAAMSSSPTLMPLLCSRMTHPVRSVEPRNVVAYKKAPLLLTPSEQGIMYSNNNNNKKCPLLPLGPVMSGVQETSAKQPLLKAPPTSGSSRLNHNNDRVATVNHHGQQQQQQQQHMMREPLIPTPPMLSSRLPDPPSHQHSLHTHHSHPSMHQKKTTPVPQNYQHTVSNTSCVKRPLLPTPSLLF